MPIPPSDLSSETAMIARVQLILAEKNTSLSVMRTGIAVFTLPLSVGTVLITTSRYYNFLENSYLIAPLLILCIGLIVLGTYLIHRAIRRIWKMDALIEKIKKNDPELAEFFVDAL